MRNLLIIAFASVALAACGSSDDTSSSDDEIVVDDSQGGEDTTDDETTSEDGPELVMSEDACETDEDCVPAGCCHAAACVAQDNAPDCTDTMCTTDCQFGTLDCGGGCLCHEGRCAARLSEEPDFAVQ